MNNLYHMCELDFWQNLSILVSRKYPPFTFLSFVPFYQVCRKENMNKKIENIQVFAGIHTVMIRSSLQSKINQESVDWINVERIKNVNQDGPLYYYILNLNRYAGTDLWTHGEFMAALFSALQEMGLSTDWVFSRVDVRFDQLEDNFKDLQKMHLLLIAAMAKYLNMGNFWTAEQALTYRKLSIKAKNTRAEIENYNKSEQRKDRDPDCPAGNRLEFRSHRVNAQIDVGDNMLEWISVARESVQKHYPHILDECNSYLLNLWNEEHQDCNKKGIWEFCRNHQETIFSRKQLEKFMEMIGRPNPHNAARAFVQKNNIEFVSKNDLDAYLGKLEAAARTYIDGTQEGYHRVYFLTTTKAEKAA